MKWLVKLTVGDLWLKLLALLVAWALWFVAREDVEEPFTTRPLTVEIDYDGRESEYLALFTDGPELGAEILAEAPTVTLELLGSRTHRTQFEALVDPRIRVRIKAFPEDVKERRQTFTRDDLEFPDLVGKELRVTDMTPADGLTLMVYRMLEKRVQVRSPEFQGIEEIAHVEAKIINFDTELTLRARKGNLEDLDEIETYIARATIERQLESMPPTQIQQEFSLPLERKGAGATMKIVGSTTLQAKVQLTRVAEEEIVVPIKIHYPSASGQLGAADRRVTYHDETRGASWFLDDDPQRPMVRLLVRGVPNVIDGLAESLVERGIEAFVVAEDLGEDFFKAVKLRINLPAGVELAPDQGTDYEVLLTPANR